MRWGLDSGFFVRLASGAPSVLEILDELRAGRASAVMSCISLFEVERLGLRGSLRRDAADRSVVTAQTIFEIADFEQVRRAARLSHGVGLSMADAIILSSVIEGGADEILTTDSDLLRYTAGPPITLI